LVRLLGFRELTRVSGFDCGGWAGRPHVGPRRTTGRPDEEPEVARGGERRCNALAFRIENRVGRNPTTKGQGLDGPRDERTDEELLSRLATDPAAFAEFYDRHVDKVIALATRRLGNPEAVADVVAAVWVDVFTAATRYRSERGAAVGWLYGVARNAVWEYRRGVQRPRGSPCTPRDSATPGSATRPTR
jgi:Sigma-70 region 2